MPSKPPTPTAHTAPALWPRRHVLAAATAALGGLALGPWARPAHAAQTSNALVFPRDLGSHNDFDIEWWYLTGYLNVPNSDTPLGVQVTFFRKRIASAAALTQQLAAKHLVFAHAAIAVPPAMKGYTAQLRHSQRTARWNGADTPPADAGASVGASVGTPVGAAAYPRAWASARTMDVGIVNTEGAWRMRALDAETFEAQVHSGAPPSDQLPATAAPYNAQDFALQLRATATQAPILQGKQGLSQKGPNPHESSWYTTHAQLALNATVTIDGQRHTLTGRGWLDHEWSHGFMPSGANGWDWVGFNFDDGSALTAFQLRGAQSTVIWAGGSWRDASGHTDSLSPSDVQFIAQTSWQSPRTGTPYPVQWQLRTPQGLFGIRPVMPDQELDSRQSTGTVYWEGLCALHRLDTPDQPRVAWGYLEMTGYGQAIEL
jgi:predicted secreted hydrolase